MDEDHQREPSEGLNLDNVTATLWYIQNEAGADMREHILVIEDDERILQFLRRGLMYEGYRVDTAEDGQGGLRIARETPPDLVILDWMLPGMDGLEVCQRLRAASDVPILMLTAKDTVADRVDGLDAGADDYLIKPFDFDELLARIRALLRRIKSESPEVLSFKDLRLDTGTHQAFRGDRPIELTAKEYELLEVFLRHPRQVLTRELIYDRVWNYDFGGESNIIEVYVRYIRQKTESEGESRLIHTVRGVGYVLREEN
jgi:two-component system response regulator MprA